MIDKATIRDRLLSRVQRDDTTKCWIYTGAWNPRGQAFMRVGQRLYTVQTVAAWLFRNIELWRPGIRYRICNSPACCNPAHIRLAPTMVEALNDMRRRKLFSTRGHKKLRPSQIRCIQYLARTGTPLSIIARDVRMTVTTVRRALTR